MVRSLFRKSISLVPWRLRSAIKKIPIVAPLQRLLLKRLLEQHEFVHTVDAGPAKGLNYPIILPEDKGIWTGTYELELATQIARAVRPGDICLDIGGWRGFFSGVMGLAGAGRVVIFEPLPANIAQIKRMIQVNPQLPLELIEAAVSNEEGAIEFCVMPESSMGKLAESSFQPEKHSGQRIKVRAVALDEWLSMDKKLPPSVIKIDAEGAELLVLRGARRLLSIHQPKLFIEIHSPALGRDCREFLIQMAYEVQSLERNDREICHLIAVPKLQQ